MRKVKIITHFIKNSFLFLLILSAGIFLRFYRLPEMASFDFDQEFSANFSYSVVKEFPIRLIGQGLSFQGLFIGPLYFYYLVPFFVIFKLHPIGGAVGSIFLSILTIVSYYFVFWKIFDKKTALIAVFLRSVLFYFLEADWSAVPSYSSEISVLWTWFCLYLYWKNNTKAIPALFFIFGLYTSFHPILFPFYFVFLIFLLIKRKFPSKNRVFIFIILGIIPVIPLIIFEFLHKFLEVNVLLSTFSNVNSIGKIGGEGFGSYLNIVFNEANKILNVDFPLKGYFLGTVTLLYVFSTFIINKSKKDNFHLIFVLLTIFTFVIYYSLLKAHIPEYYFLGPVMILFFYFCSLLGAITKKPAGTVAVCIFLSLIAVRNYQILTSKKWNNPSLVAIAHKDDIVKSIINRQDGKTSFYISFITSPGWNFGYNYLFKLYGKVPSDKIEEDMPVYTIVSPKSMCQGSIGYSSGNIGLIFPDKK